MADEIPSVLLWMCYEPYSLHPHSRSGLRHGYCWQCVKNHSPEINIVPSSLSRTHKQVHRYPARTYRMFSRSSVRRRAFGFTALTTITSQQTYDVTREQRHSLQIYLYSHLFRPLTYNYGIQTIYKESLEIVNINKNKIIRVIMFFS